MGLMWWGCVMGSEVGECMWGLVVISTVSKLGIPLCDDYNNASVIVAQRLWMKLDGDGDGEDALDLWLECEVTLKCKVATCTNQNADMEHQLPCQQKY